MNKPVDPIVKSQLDRPERQRLERKVCEMREKAENDIGFRIRDYYGIEDVDTTPEYLSTEEQETRDKLIEAVHREQGKKRDWEKAVDLFIKGCAYTLINRLAAFRCMEVRGFLERAVTRFRDDGKTPAADPVIRKHFLDDKEGVAEAFRDACRQMTDEIEIVFDPTSAYSVLDVDLDDALFDTYEAVCRLLDEVDDQTWRADDVLGWVYEYYNLQDLPRVQEKAKSSGGLDPEDVPAANQFYTPHWVVRMLTDNSLGKLYLEHRGEFQETIQRQAELYQPEQRKSRENSPEAAPTVAELCAYLVPSDKEGQATDTLWKGGPEELKVIDPACGSGHFLLYAFDVLERIWWKERPNLDRSRIPSKILRHNLFGVDLDMRACQLAAFNLYLKARTRAEQEGGAFTMPPVGIVCADVHLASLEGADEVFAEVADGNDAVREVLHGILDAFEATEGLGSLLDVKGTLSKSFFEKEKDLPLFSRNRDVHDILEALHNEIGRHRGDESFQARDLKSFLHLLVVLSHDYDVALMNPPYGARSRIPAEVKKYIEKHYDYTPEFYINFFEVCERLTKENGRVGMLVPRSFLFKRTFEEFREDFFQGRGAFDFLAEYGLGVLDNATVRTVGTVVRTGLSADVDTVGEFFRLADLETTEKEGAFLAAAFGEPTDDEVVRKYSRPLSEFKMIPGAPVSYWVPKRLRRLFESDVVLDAENARLNKVSLGAVKQGLATGDDGRFLRHFWEVPGDESWVPIAKGGEDTAVLPRVTLSAQWAHDGSEIKRYPGSRAQNTQYYFKFGVTYNRVKSDGRRFSLLYQGSIFGDKGPVVIPSSATTVDELLPIVSYLNSRLVTYFVLSQTPERMWEIGEVSRLPWKPELGVLPELRELARELTAIVVAQRGESMTSPHYRGPALLPMTSSDKRRLSLYRHPHRRLSEHLPERKQEPFGPEMSLSQRAIAVEKARRQLEQEAQEIEGRINEVIFQHFEIDEQERHEVFAEIALRTNEDPREQVNQAPDAVTEPPEDYRELIQRMLLHLVLEVIEEDEDGVVPLLQESDDEESALLSRLQGKFQEVFGEHAHDRLEEIDQILGRKSSSKEAYPNIQHWLERDLFDFHISTFENAPIIWKVTTERLVADPKAEGFACLVGYHQLDHNLFSTIRNRYIEKREKALREKLTAARQRLTDAGLSAKERNRWEIEQVRCESALRQIQAFRDTTADLKRSRPRDWNEENRQLAENLAGLVAEFRQRTAERLETLDAVHQQMPEKQFVDHFSPKFMESVNGNREEWLDALEDLEEACRAYAASNDQPVRAHLYDLFVYFDKLAGSTHYASNGILFMNYYFEKGKNYLKAAGQLETGLQPHERLLGELARETGRDVELGEQIRKACKKLSKELPSDWKTRALEEVMVAGWNPVKKHGVAINIQPLAEAKIVPKSVDENVI
ncbi:BREX-5 system adenine-specific DNA-methyltransferase PglX [Persicimonas caeni]|uniref:site-specific DNA-methyltransferase (adenine-specific) n=1 Tax=Persicimonas caeni TaxID=2292766 RepID=A0A4Y6PUN8_PERCE|nr:BREX-5 system adenine-specific DNA-methyltransferase PglX [Persicimonas caeni]QDG52064.1 BREX-5 system adenine-specific DNA-methyltransferase PglX [Persicimonas caeni]QED33285.1 BREX-5 system adenine-specific DNA-methyltransferase PglX [Persicimonas caeni]